MGKYVIKGYYNNLKKLVLKYWLMHCPVKNLFVSLPYIQIPSCS